MNEDLTIVDFTKDTDSGNWTVVNDIVMGGCSEANFQVNSLGHGQFSGRVSLENKGGFSSVSYRFALKDVRRYDKAVLRLKGDCKTYQFRLKSNLNDSHSYAEFFTTTGDWQTLEINFADMHPRFRGRILDLPNYPGESMCELAFLIANKKAEVFCLEIDSIHLK